jgi:hypothetical protein
MDNMENKLICEIGALGMATKALSEPTADDIRRAEKEFDRENEPIEWLLTELFERFPANMDFGEVVLKTKVLNVLYSTQIRAVIVVARHILTLAVDTDLRAGKPEVVDRIARVQLKGKTRSNFSFASKYCQWHQPAAYPIYDGNVEACLWRYKNQGGIFGATLAERGIVFRRYGYGYAEFVRIVNAFRDAYKLTSFTYKQLDKLLWSLGGRLLPVEKE